MTDTTATVSPIQLVFGRFKRGRRNPVYEARIQVVPGFYVKPEFAAMVGHGATPDAAAMDLLRQVGQPLQICAAATCDHSIIDCSATGTTTRITVKA